MSTNYDWEGLLADLADTVARYKEPIERHVRPFVPDKYPVGALLRNPGASESELMTAAVRFGKPLPPSYAEFLHCTNGCTLGGLFIDELYSINDVGLFQDMDSERVDMYLIVNEEYISGELPSVPDRLYNIYGKGQSTSDIRLEYLPHLLQISNISCLTSDDVLLLNPEVIGPDGEWEAWAFANNKAGANRYQSFWLMMKAEIERFTEFVRTLP